MVLPVVAFLTDIFHPLVTPLTTYMYSTDVQEEGNVSASDDQRLPPGGFSLSYAFPGWHGQRSWRDADTINSSKNAPASNSTDPSTNDPAKAEAIPPAGHVSIFEILRYVRRSFEEECLLNTLPIEAAGNPGAWHAWRTFQAKNGKLISISPEPVDSVDAESDEVSQSMSFTVSSGRKPGDWNWDGVWEERVKKGIENSMADSVLYGLTSSGDQLINFLNMDPIEIEAIRENMSRATGAR